MDEAMKKMLAELAGSVKALSETVTARFSSVDPVKTEAEKDALIERVLTLEKSTKALESIKAVRKMAWGISGQKAGDGQTLVGFTQFLRAVQNKDHAFLSEMKAASGESEGVNADGGFSVPVEYANQIIALERQSSIIRKYARIFPMGSKTRAVSRELAKPTVYWVGEGAEPTALSKGTLDQITQTAKKLTAIVPFTEELLEDNNVGFETFIAEVVAQEMGREEDKQALVGDVSGLSDPFNGVYFASGVNSVSLESATLGYPDLVNLLMAPRSTYRGRGVFVLSATALKQCMKLIDDLKRPIWSMPEAGAPGRLLGRAYEESDQIPDTLGTTRTNGTNTGILFGAWDALWLSPRGGYSVTASQSASNAAGKSAFTLDETWFKFRRREDISVANPEALAKLAIPTV